jgi:hypothetical protein
MDYYRCTKCPGKDCLIGVGTKQPMVPIMCLFFPEQSAIGRPLQEHYIKLAKWEKIE